MTLRALAVVAVVTVNILAGSAADASAAPRIVPDRGVWEGTNAAGTRIAFDVDRRGVVNVVFGGNCLGNASGSAGPMPEHAPVKDGAFAKRYGHGYAIKGRFTRAGRAVGTAVAPASCPSAGRFTVRRVRAPESPQPGTWTGSDSLGGALSFTVTDRWHGGPVMLTTRFAHSFISSARVCVPAIWGPVRGAIWTTDVYRQVDRLGALSFEEPSFPEEQDLLTMGFRGSTAHGTWRVIRTVDGQPCDSGDVSWTATLG